MGVQKHEAITSPGKLLLCGGSPRSGYGPARYCAWWWPKPFEIVYSPLEAKYAMWWLKFVRKSRFIRHVITRRMRDCYPPVLPRVLVYFTPVHGFYKGSSQCFMTQRGWLRTITKHDSQKKLIYATVEFIKTQIQLNPFTLYCSSYSRSVLSFF